MTSQTAAMQIADFHHLQPGQRLEARLNSTVHHHGLVDQIAPALGLVWITEEPLGTRKLLHIDDYVFWSA